MQSAEGIGEGSTQSIGKASLGSVGSVGRSSIGTASLDNPLYEPNAEEVENFGRFLGLDIFAEGHLIWIAEEGLRMGLPEASTQPQPLTHPPDHQTAWRAEILTPVSFGRVGPTSRGPRARCIS